MDILDVYDGGDGMKMNEDRNKLYTEYLCE